MPISSYEAIYIVSADFDDEQVTLITDRFAKVVTDNGGEVEQAGKWEKRKLAYEIANHRDGTYCLMLFKAEHSVPAELSRLFRITDDIIRARIYRKDD